MHDILAGTLCAKTMNADKKIEHTWKLFLINQEMIKFSDLKLRFLAVISGVLTSYVLANFSTLVGQVWYGQLSLAVFCISFLIFIFLLSFHHFRDLRQKRVIKSELGAQLVFEAMVVRRIDVAI